jgi:hypothetical protein
MDTFSLRVGRVHTIRVKGCRNQMQSTTDRRAPAAFYFLGFAVPRHPYLRYVPVLANTANAPPIAVYRRHTTTPLYFLLRRAAPRCYWFHLDLDESQQSVTRLRNTVLDLKLISPCTSGRTLELQKLSIRLEYHHDPEVPLSYKSSQSSCGKQNNGRGKRTTHLRRAGDSFFG